MIKSPLDKTQEVYDVVIIGGGISGAGIFRDLSLHGLSCLLVDHKDFGSQTSQASSKMLHGGLRYLENCDFSLVKEALGERNFWLKSAPQLCYEQQFLLPIYPESKWSWHLTKVGLMAYDLLAGPQNKPHHMLNKQQTLLKIPGLKKEGLYGSGVYYDAIMDDTKMTLTVILDSLLNKSCQALNYVKFIDFKNLGDTNLVVLEDRLVQGKRKTIFAKELVFALGPFTDKVLLQTPNLNWKPILLPSKGSHLQLMPNSVNIKNPVVLTTKDNRIIFLIPRQDSILVGTTEEKITTPSFDPYPSQKEVSYLLKAVNDYFPKANVTHAHILSMFSGIRPLIKGKGQELGKTSRTSQIYQPFHNVHVLAGGKYTTFRIMGQPISRMILAKKNGVYNSSLTEQPFRRRLLVPAFQKSSFEEKIVKQIIDQEFVRTFDDLIKRRMGIPSPKHWKKSYANEKDLKEFFLPLLPFMAQRFKVTEEDIRYFTNDRKFPLQP